MAITKTQLLNKLQNLKDRCSPDSKKYYLLGIVRILIQKDIITISDILAEFPELN